MRHSRVGRGQNEGRGELLLGSPKESNVQLAEKREFLQGRAEALLEAGRRLAIRC